MAQVEERELKPTPEAEGLYRRWLAHLNEEFSRHPAVDRRAEVVRDELYQIYLGRPHGGKMNASLSSEWGANVLAETFDPRNVVLAAEYLEGIDREQFAPRKPLIWFWKMFDRSPLGMNHWLGWRLRCMLGQHIFAHIGKGVKMYRDIEFTFGYNLTLEDHCTIGRGAVLDDRQPLLVRAATSVEAGEKIGPATEV